MRRPCVAKVKPFYRLEADRPQIDPFFLTHSAYLRANSRWVELKVGAINRLRILQLVNHLKNHRGRMEAQPPKKQQEEGTPVE